MLAAPEIAWKAFVLAMSLLSCRVVGPGWDWVWGEVVRLQGPGSWPKPGDNHPFSSATCCLARSSTDPSLHEVKPGFFLSYRHQASSKAKVLLHPNSVVHEGCGYAGGWVALLQLG